MSERGHRSTDIPLPLFVSALILLLLYLKPAFLEHLSGELQDRIQKLSPPHISTPSTAIVAIDQKSVGMVGEWPWSPNSISKLIDVVAAAKPRVIGFVPCRNRSGIGLGRAIRRTGPLVILYRFKFVNGGFDGSLQDIEKSRIKFITNPWGTVRDYSARCAEGLQCSNAALVKSAFDCGFSGIVPGSGGVVREIPLVCKADGHPYQSFAIALLKTYYGVADLVLKLSGDTVVGLALEDFLVKTSGDGTIYLREYSNGAKIPVFSAADILRGDFERSNLADKIVLIGGTRTGGFPTYRTAVSKAVPEVFIQVTAVENILNGQSLRRTRICGWLEIVLIVILPLAVAVLFRFCARFRYRCLIVLAMLGVILGLALCLIARRSEMLGIFYPSLGVLLCWGLLQYRKVFINLVV